MKVADSDLDGIGREGAGGQHTQADRADEQSDHVFSLTFLFDCTDDRGTSSLKHDRIVLPCNRHFATVLPWISRVPIMKPLFVLMALTLVVSSPARADPPKVAVFDFELLDTSLQGEVDGPRADEQRRLKDVAEQLRKALAEAGKFGVPDIAPVKAAAHASNLQACGGCDVQHAQQLGADLAI